MWAVMFISLLFVTALYASEDSCSEMKGIGRVPSSASGRWYLVATKNQDIKSDKALKKSRRLECGGTKLPCFCVGFDINSTMMEPFIPEYNMTNFYKTLSGEYMVHSYKMQLANRKSEMEIFNIKQKDEGDTFGDTMVLRNLATDDYQSFMLMHVCDDKDQELDIWFLSKSMVPSEESIDGMNKAFLANGLAVPQLEKTSLENCE